eukprot:scaffold73024_cov61-Attheya_sp.AAC.7
MVVPLHYYCSRRSNNNWRRQTAEERCSVIRNKHEEEDEYESAMAFLREFHNKNEEDDHENEDRLLSRASTHATLCSIPEESSSLSDDEHCLDSYSHHGNCMKKSDTCQSFEPFVSSPAISNGFDDDDDNDDQQQHESYSSQHDLEPFSNTEWGNFDPSEDTTCGSSKNKSPPSKAVANDDMSSSCQGHSKGPEPRRRPFSKWRFSFRSIRTTLFKQCI